MSLFTQSPTENVGNARFFGGRVYPDPFVTYATIMMPRTIEDKLRWCEHLWHRNGTYAMASRRVVRYFLTQLEITDASEDEKKKWDEFLNDDLKVMVTAAYCGDDFMCYGNSFTSIYVPFRRFLRCKSKSCKIEQPLKELDYKFKAGKFEYKCPKCGYVSTTDKPVDRRTMEEDKVKIIRWPVHQIRIKHHPISQENVYLWEPPATLKKQVKEGDPFILETIPWEMVESILQDKPFQFAPGVVYHMKEEGVAGVNSAGWGISRFMTNFSQAFHVQMLKLYNEVLCQEYIVPFRVISPAPGGGNTPDPMITTNLGSFNGRIQGMLRDFRKRPGGYHFVPFPINYQVLGGEGMQMTTHELIDQALDEMLNAAGVPAELYKGTLQVQAMPTALRLFQQSWPHFVAAVNGWLQWLMETLSIVFNWESAKCQLQPVTLADDIENKQILLQLAAANQVSKHKAFGPLGIDPDEDQDLIFEEQETWQDKQQKMQAKMQNKQMLEQQMQSTAMQAAGATGPGQAGAGGQQAAVTPGDIMSQADQIAQQLLAMPESQRRSELLKIKKSDETLHALVKSKMEGQRTQAEAQGRQQLQAQPGNPAAQPMQ
jgi:hypothetical protein